MRNTTFAAIALPVASILLFSAAAAALDRQAEAGAKAAIKAAAALYKQQQYDDAIQKLADALNTCGDNGCSNPTKAGLLRDLGALRLKQSGGKAMAEQALVAAAQTDPKVAINPAYDSPELQEELAAAKDEAKWSSKKQPEGDFTHTPATEEAVNTPLPIFVAYSGSEKISKVIVHYVSPGEDSPKTMALKKRSGGFGALVPCAGVTRGMFQYWIEGQDSTGGVVASAGSSTEPYFVPIHGAIDGAGPSLPGAHPPKSCDECPDRTPVCDGEASEPGEETTSTGEEGEGEKKEEEKPGSPYARFWIGAGGSIEIMSMPSGTDVCKLTDPGAAPTTDYYCTNGDGSDFPSHASAAENGMLDKGNAGTLPGGIAFHDVKVFLSFDYAFTANIMGGLRLGYVPSAYPGKAAVNDGHAFGTPLHFELRGTYIFGKDALAKTGLAPILIAGGGVSEFHGQNQVVVTQTETPPAPNVTTHKEAWFTGGPVFFELGGGARYAISSRFAIIADAHLTVALGGLSGWIGVTPEASAQIGF